MAEPLPYDDDHPLENIICFDDLNRDIAYQEFVEELGISSVDQQPDTDHIDIPDILKEHATCDICLDIIVKPMTLICQHSFCYECLVRLIKKEKDMNNQLVMHNHDAGAKYKCPSCKFPFIFPNKRSYNYMLEALINELTPDAMKITRKVAIAKRDFEDMVREELREELMEVMLEHNAKKTVPDLNYKKPQQIQNTYFDPLQFIHKIEPENITDHTVVYAVGTGLAVTSLCIGIALLSQMTKY